MEKDYTEAKRYVLRELMDEMDQNERKKLKQSFKPDSEPWKGERATTETDMHDDLAGKMLSGKVEAPHAAQGVTETPPSTGSSSDNSEDNEPVADSIGEYSRRRYKRA